MQLASAQQHCRMLQQYSRHATASPFAVQALPRCQHHQRGGCVAAAAYKRTSTRQSPVTTGLTTVLKDELKIEKERYRTPEAVLEGPPGGYELEDRPNCTVLLLTRSFGSEEIVVEVDIDSQAEGGGDDDDDAAEQDEDDEELDSLPPVTFSVNINKGDRIMAFSCETDGSEVLINHVSLSDAPEPEEEEEENDDLVDFAPYTGPVFSELDDTLQQAFADYLEERGITADFGTYLMELVHDKLEVEYMNWLQRAREFIDD